MDLKKIDFELEEERTEIRRPFTVKVEASVAKDFIAAVHSNGWYVRETLVKLMRKFSRVYGKRPPDESDK